MCKKKKKNERAHKYLKPQTHRPRCESNGELKSGNFKRSKSRSKAIQKWPSVRSPPLPHPHTSPPFTTSSNLVHLLCSHYQTPPLSPLKTLEFLHYKSSVLRAAALRNSPAKRPVRRKGRLSAVVVVVVVLVVRGVWQ